MASSNSSGAPLFAPLPIVQCAWCKRVRRDGEWHPVLNLIAEPNEVSHGICPRCDGEVRGGSPLTQARTLRSMVDGNLDMVRKLVRCGDVGMALRETEQALNKIDQLLNSIS